MHLRGWQKEAFALYKDSLEKKKNRALWEATPGAGKTAAALAVVRHQLYTKISSNVLVVVPTTHLRTQWAHSAAKFGIQLDSSFGGNRTLSNEFHGIVVTYQQLGRREKWFREFASKSVVVLDEVHHAGDGLTWGNLLLSILENSKYILCLSGTAFRSDSNPIPYVTYDAEGMSVPDYTYSYTQAVEDGVCRPTAFFTYGGAVSWSENNLVYSTSFSDSLDKTASARRLRSSLDPDSGWIQPMFNDAHQMLLTTRKEHPTAGGLIVCSDQTHARKIAKLIFSLTGQKPTVVLSDDSGASLKIKKFTDSSDLWLVACNMVSEGVDIPRLRVGVYATTIRTKMYFRQFLGRIVRRQSNIPGHQIAYFYLPADPILALMAEEVETETKHCLLKPKDDLFPDDERNERINKEKDPQSTWTALSAKNSGVNSVILHGNQLPLFADNLSSELVQEVINKEFENLLVGGLTKSENKLKLATEIKRLVGLLHRRTKKTHSQIYLMLNQAQSVKSQTLCTEKQLQERVMQLEKLLFGGQIEMGMG